MLLVSFKLLNHNYQLLLLSASSGRGGGSAGAAIGGAIAAVVCVIVIIVVVLVILFYVKKSQVKKEYSISADVSFKGTAILASTIHLPYLLNLYHTLAQYNTIGGLAFLKT